MELDGGMPERFMIMTNRRIDKWKMQRKRFRPGDFFNSKNIHRGP